MLIIIWSYLGLTISEGGVPERLIESLGVMGWGWGGVGKFFRRRRHRRRRPPWVSEIHKNTPKHIKIRQYLFFYIIFREKKQSDERGSTVLVRNTPKYTKTRHTHLKIKIVENNRMRGKAQYLSETPHFWANKNRRRQPGDRNLVSKGKGNIF